MRTFDVVTFDCYGTLIDWERGIVEAFRREATMDGRSLETVALLRAYHEMEPVVEAGVYRRYREVLTETAARVAERLGWALPTERARFLADSLPDWPPFPDTNAALERLAAAGHRLGILSNVDDELLAGTRRHFHVDFDLIVTAQQVGAYKPAAPHFRTARGRLGAARWLHAAQSYVHDVVPARAESIPVAWINRKGERPGGEVRPDHEFRTLTDLADWLAPE